METDEEVEVYDVVEMSESENEEGRKEGRRL